jgi:catecholate siderophore receptor
MVTYGASTRDANATDIGVFAMDRWWLTNQFSLQGALRWDYFESEYEISTGAFGGSAVAKEWSPSISAIWEPTKEYTAYASYSRTYRPVGTDIAAAVGGVGSEVPRDDRDNNPERADVYEVGVKADLFGGNLGLTGAIFQIDKDNSFTVDEFGNVEQAFSDNGQGRRIRGVELGVTGKLTDYWTAYLAYAYLDGEVTFASDPLLIGNNAPGVAHNNFSFWTTYDLPQSVTTLPGVVTLGGGFQYASDYWADSANTALIPDTFSLDTMISYKTDDYRISLNGYNLTDHLNYSSSFNSVRAVPISGRTFMLNIGATF